MRRDTVFVDSPARSIPHNIPSSAVSDDSEIPSFMRFAARMGFLPSAARVLMPVDRVQFFPDHRFRDLEWARQEERTGGSLNEDR